MIAGEKDDYAADDQLTLADDDERLPWLESGDEDDEDEGVDSGRIIGFAILALLALAAFIGGIWWFGNRGDTSEVVADGSTIEAPDSPYKTRPAEPGGKQFEGTGNLAPAVGEGRETEGRIADRKPAPAATPAASQSPAAEPASAPAAASGTVVQVGAYSSKADAEAGWQKLQRQTEHLAGVSHRVVQGQADIGTVYRLQALAGDAAAASRLCTALKGDGVACQVK
ncbi:SPOR domain-containing protein [Tsuneonella sp. SYSU-LHT278]|uniref:SPOR domain-containing protein n=1 Tax=Tsuneonella sediminis TaxID=3416089 RepID=UPI003F78FDFD